MRMSHWFPRLFLLALALTLVLSGIPALAEESEGNAPENPAVILSANPTTGYTWAVEIADEAVISVTDEGVAPNDEALTGAKSAGLHHRYLYLCPLVGDGRSARLQAGVRPVGGRGAEGHGCGHHVPAGRELTDAPGHAAQSP